MAAREEKPTAPAPARVSRSGFLAMGAILIAMAFLAIYSNVQKARRDQIETVTIIAASPTPASTLPSPSPAAP